jgi:hypothetical protein
VAKKKSSGGPRKSRGKVQIGTRPVFNNTTRDASKQLPVYPTPA